MISIFISVHEMIFIVNKIVPQLPIYVIICGFLLPKSVHRFDLKLSSNQIILWKIVEYQTKAIVETGN